MSDRGGLQFGLVGEDALSRELAVVLADRVGSELLDQAWDLDPAHYPERREWRGRERSSPFSTPADFAGPPIFGHGLVPLEWAVGPGAKFVAKVVRAFAGAPIEVLLIAMDEDRDHERAAAQRRARDMASRMATFPIVLALMNPEAEAWEIASFHPSTAEALARYAAVKALLTFDPVREPHRLTSTSGRPERDCKTVHGALLDGERPCRDRTLAELGATVTSTGLPTYLVDIEAALRVAFDVPKR